MSDRDKTAYLMQLLIERHAPKVGFLSEWATFTELMEAPVGGQRIDFFAVHTWRSKNYCAIAYEVKVSRGDFLKELRMPEKRRFAERVSHECYFVAPRGMIRREEVPDPWGLIEPKPGTRGLHIIKATDRKKDVRWDMHFTMAMVRRAADKLATQKPLLELETVGNGVEHG